jgi:DNA-binding SARP family transcriptional activator
VTLSALQIRLLGSFDRRYDGAPVPGLNKARLQSLLAYLILHAGSPLPRQHAAFLLWPDAPEAHACNNLRQFLHQLRQALPEPDRFLTADANTVCWQRGDGQAIDVHLFLGAVRESETAARHGDSPAVRRWLERALACYQGNLLPGCYDEWIAPEREQLRQSCQTVCQKLAAVLEEGREYTAAAQVVQQLLRFDPPSEEAYVALMRLQGLALDRSGVRRTYQSAVETLRRELGVDPREVLRQAYERYQLAIEPVPSPAGPDRPASG